MNANIFFEFFDLLAEAPSSVAKLRELILQLAVEGKLVPQNPKDESASLVLDRVLGHRRRQLELDRSEKAVSAISAGLQRPPASPISGRFDEVHSIPPNWVWASWGEVSASENGAFKRGPFGSSLRKADFVGSGYKVYEQYCPINDDCSFARYYITNAKFKSMESFAVRAGDFLISCSGSIGRITQVPDNFEAGIINQALLRVRICADLLDSGYFKMVFRSPYFQRAIIENSTGSAITNVKGVKELKAIPVPIPPLAEQKRVVSKVGELLGLCDELETRQGARRELRERLVQTALDQLLASRDAADFATHWQRLRLHFDILIDTPDALWKLRQAILQLAARGNLVGQDPTEKPAPQMLADIKRERQILVTQKKIPNQREVQGIPSEDVPYELPNGWTWARFGDVCLYIEAGWSPKCEERQRIGDEWGILKISAVTWDRFNPNENKALPANLEPRLACEVKAGDFLMSRANTAELVAKSVVVESTPPRLLLNDKVLRVIFPEVIDPSYINLVNNGPFSRQHYIRVASGTSESMRNVSRENVLDMLIPVPPEQEQRRIVEKTNALLKMCDDLNAQLQNSSEAVDRLVAVAVGNLLAAESQFVKDSRIEQPKLPSARGGRFTVVAHRTRS